MSALGLSLAAVGGTPDPNGLPGGAALQKLADGLMFWGLIACLVGLVASAAIWALSSYSGNYQHSASGRRGTLGSAGGAILIGAAPAIVTFFENVGHTVK
jgi:hypothetical protein